MHHLLDHWGDVLTGVTLTAIVAHAVNTFPVPKNQYGQWFLGIIKFGVGQRLSTMNAFRGNDTVSVPVPQGTGAGIQSSQSNVVQHGESITITEKTRTVIPTVGTGE